MQRRRFLTSALAGSVAVTSARLAVAQPQTAAALPAGPIRIVVGFSPGGGTDVLSRLLAQKLTELWGQSVVVENKPGAAGGIAAEHVARAAGDGTTLLMTTSTNHAIAPFLYPKLGYVVERDFRSILLVGVTPQLLTTATTQSVRSLKDIIARCKAQPDTVTFGSSGAGSSQHMALELFKLRAGVTAVHVPYRGSGALLADLVGGQIDYCFDSMTAATPHVKGGKLLAVAQTRPRRSPAWPDVPTVAELGYPDFDASVWYGLVAPSSLPTALAQRMNDDLNRIFAMPEVAERLIGFGAEDGGGSIARFDQFIASETVKWGQVVRDAKVTG